MKIVYLVMSPMDPNEIARRGELLKKWASPGVDVDIRAVSTGPSSIESLYEEYLCIPEAAREIFRLEKEGYDGAIIGCADDPGLFAMREITSRMVIAGPGESSIHLAAMLGHRFSILAPLDNAVNQLHALAYRAGGESKLASVRSIDLAVLDLAQDRSITVDKIIHEGKEAIEMDRADTLILGCMSLGFLDMAKEIQEALNIPVINPCMAALKVAEAMVGSGLTHSKRAFRLPPKLASGKVSSLDELLID